MSPISPDLSAYSSAGFRRGRPFWVDWLWRLISAAVFQSSCVPFYGPKRFLLRLFGARVGTGVLIKPRVTITFPWRVTLGDYVWIGEEVRLESLAEIRIGSHACISQRAYLCTGNHDFRSRTFDLRTESIEVGAGAWVAAGAIVGPGVKVGPGAILALGSVAVSDLAEDGIYSGNPAARTGTRTLRS